MTTSGSAQPVTGDHLMVASLGTCAKPVGSKRTAPQGRRNQVCSASSARVDVTTAAAGQATRLGIISDEVLPQRGGPGQVAVLGAPDNAAAGGAVDAEVDPRALAIAAEELGRRRAPSSRPMSWAGAWPTLRIAPGVTLSPVQHSGRLWGYGLNLRAKRCHGRRQDLLSEVVHE